MTNYLDNTDFMTFDDFKDKLNHPDCITYSVTKDMEDNGFNDIFSFRKFLEEYCDTGWYSYLLSKMIEEGYVETIHQLKDNKTYYRFKGEKPKTKQKIQYKIKSKK